MLKIGLLIFIGLVFLIAWFYGIKRKIKIANGMKEVPAAPSATNLSRHDRVSGKLFRRIYPTLNEKNKLRKEKHWMKVFEYRIKDILWTPFGLFWMTRELADQHKND